jgi:hypothetical protein
LILETLTAFIHVTQVSQAKDGGVIADGFVATKASPKIEMPVKAALL